MPLESAILYPLDKYLAELFFFFFFFVNEGQVAEEEVHRGVEARVQPDDE